MTVQPRRYHALSIIEVLLALAIGAIMLTAIAAAMQAAAHTCTSTERLLAASQAGRTTMRDIITKIRLCDACSIGSPNALSTSLMPDGQTQYKQTTSNSLTLISNTGVRWYYTWNSGILSIAKESNPASTAAENITNMSFTAHWLCSTDPATGQVVWYVDNVRISMDIDISGQTFHLADSVVPRRAMSVR